MPSKKHKKTLIVVFAIAVLLLVISGSYLLFHHGPISDTETEQDLATIAKAEIDYYNKYQSSNSSPPLPSILSKLKLGHLSNRLSSYQYKYDGSSIINQDSYTICADFQTNTFSLSSYNKFQQTSGTIASDYSVHGSGKQCYDNNITSGGEDVNPGISIDLSTPEYDIVYAKQPVSFNFTQLTSTMYSDYQSQAKLLGFQASENDLVKQCQRSLQVTKEGQKLYLCTIEITKNSTTSVTNSTRNSMIDSFQSLTNSEGYTGSIEFGPCTSTSALCDYMANMANSNNSYCSLDLIYSATQYPPYNTDYRFDCNNIPYVLQVPAGFKLVSIGDSLYNGGT